MRLRVNTLRARLMFFFRTVLYMYAVVLMYVLLMCRILDNILVGFRSAFIRNGEEKKIDDRLFEYSA